MLRRDFLRQGSLLVAGGLLVGDEALEAFARLTHVRKSFPSAALHRGGPTIITDAELQDMLRQVYTKFRMETQHLATPLLAQLGPAQARRNAMGTKLVYWDVAVKPNA